MRSQDVRVRVDGDRVTVRGVRRAPEAHNPLRVHRMEIAFGPFERTIRVEVPFDPEQVSAHLEDGFLVVSLQKREPLRRRVAVTGESS